jgi:VWFA-related protein
VSTPPAEAIELERQDREKVTMVLLPTTVTDRRGRFVTGLGTGDFVVYEDQVPQHVEFVSSEALQPISLAFLLDVSGSMRLGGKLEQAKGAIRTLVQRLWKRDQVALITFADDHVSWQSAFTSDREPFLQVLERQQGYGQTALHDAVAATPALVDQSLSGRKAIVLISDGIENFSELSAGEAIALARRVNIPIYTIAFLSAAQAGLPEGHSDTNLQLLEQFSAETGGRAFALREPLDLDRAVTELESELRQQYLIGYYSSNPDADGRFRPVRLELRNRRLEARTRSGYVATP